MNYLIRATNKRLWYVNEFLIPEMLKQGISEKEIRVFEDNSGNLSSFINMCKFIAENYRWYDFVWVLQDDVMISDDFYKKTFEFRNIEVNGFCSGVDNIENSGFLQPDKSWLSFQCKNLRADKLEYFLDWYKVSIQYNSKIKSLANTGKHDDLIYF